MNPLFDADLERDLVCMTFAMLETGDARAHQALLNLPPAALMDSTCRDLWTGMRALYRRGELPDATTLKAELGNTGKLRNETDWMVRYLDKLSSGSTIGNPVFCAGEVLALFQRREASKLLGRVQAQVQDRTEDHLAALADLSQAAINLTAGDLDEETPAGEEILGMIERGERFALDQATGKLLYFGIEALDEHIPGSAQNLCIIAARPGKGKTALLVQSLCATAKAGIPSLFVSLELPKVEALARITSHFTNVKSGSLWAGTYGSGTEGAMRLHRDSANQITVWAAPSQTPWIRIEAKIRGAVIRKGVKVVAIDYFGLIGRPEAGKNSNPYYEAAKLSGQIRALAQSLNICILLLCQLNREGAEGEPGMEDLRETGQLEQDAQTILALWTAKPKGSDRDVAERMQGVIKASAVESPMLKVLKNRNGRAGEKWAVDFDGATNRFEVLCAPVGSGQKAGTR